MLTQEQAENLANEMIQKYIGELKCADVNQVAMGLQKLMACTGFAYAAVKGHENVIDLLNILAKRFGEMDEAPPKLEVVRKGKLNG